jgi:hypothetical protein
MKLYEAQMDTLVLPLFKGTIMKRRDRRSMSDGSVGDPLSRHMLLN